MELAAEKTKLEYNGEVGIYIKYSGCTKTQQRKWTKEEEAFLLIKAKKYTLSEVAECLNRTYQSIHLKYKRLNKSSISNNKPTIDKKYETNDLFIKLLNPKSILDVFAGHQSYYHNLSNVKVISNDKNNKNHHYNMDALKLLMHLNIQDKKFDIVDLDPFGSAYDYIELALKIAKKGIIITYGEFGHKRYKRIDYVKHRYNISNFENFNIDKIILETQRLGLIHKKILIPKAILNSKGLIYRVYFKILPDEKKPTYRL